jgi:hypothetical protein
VYSAAIDKKQASLLFAEMAAIIDEVPEFDERTNVQRFHKIIEVLDGPGKGSIYEALSADVRRDRGLAPSLWIYDEYAHLKTSELVDNLQTAQGVRKDGRALHLLRPGRSCRVPDRLRRRRAPAPAYRARHGDRSLPRTMRVSWSRHGGG